MYEYIKGTLARLTPTEVIVEVNGMGYFIHAAPSLSQHMPSLGEEVILYTKFVVREDAHTLYGFASSQERDLFSTLLGISGIGPKSALALVGCLALDEFIDAINHNNIPLICKAPGIGKKSAERLILELKHKLPTLFQVAADAASLPSQKYATSSQVIRDAISALTNLGYTQSNAEKAIQRAVAETEQELALPELISSALRSI